MADRNGLPINTSNQKSVWMRSEHKANVYCKLQKLPIKNTQLKLTNKKSIQTNHRAELIFLQSQTEII